MDTGEKLLVLLYEFASAFALGVLIFTVVNTESKATFVFCMPAIIFVIDYFRVNGFLRKGLDLDSEYSEPPETRRNKY